MGVMSGTPVTASSGNVAAGTATATIPAVLNKTAHITGFEITAGGAVAAAAVNATVVGLLGGTLTYSYGAALGAGVISEPLLVTFDPPLPASGPNVAIVVSMPTLGVGNTNACIVSHGFYTPPA